MLELITPSPHESVTPVRDTTEPDAPSPFAPLFTCGTEPYALATPDELGRPLAGVYVPDELLL